MQDQHEQTSGTQLLSYYKLQGFNGYCFIQHGILAGKRATGSARTSQPPRITLLNRQKLGHLTQIIIIALAKSGNVETNPGPPNQNLPISKKRKYNIKFQCSVCSKGIRSRVVYCSSCENIAHLRCIKDLSKETYDSYSNKSDNIPYLCKCCINKNGLSVSSIYIRNIEDGETLEQVVNSPPSPSLPSNNDAQWAHRPILWPHVIWYK